VRRRHAEGGHHGVADELLDGPTFGFDLRAHRRERRLHHVLEAFGVEQLGEPSRARDVREEDGNQLALLEHRRRPLVQRRRAGSAEAKAFGILLAAGGANRHDPSVRQQNGVG
jgi:hypothetical protein